MNFLAHLFLTYNEEELTVGNYIADFIRNRHLSMFDDRVVQGVMIHRFIDQFTDTHPSVLASTRILHERHGKYAPVVIDVFYDYILTKNWHLFTDIELREFCDTTYSVLNSNSELFPDYLRDITYRMIADDFLIKYGTIDGLNKTFYRIGRRAKFESNFESAVLDLEEHYDAINNGFLEFFPEIVDAVKQEILKINLDIKSRSFIGYRSKKE